MLDFGTLSDDADNDLPHELILPAYTAAAHFHKKLPADLQADLPKALAKAWIEAEIAEPVKVEKLEASAPKEAV